MPHSSPKAAPRRQPDQTRQHLLDCAFDEIHRSGFRAASLDAILESSGVTKGALYHHFAHKTALGHAVIEERVRPWVEALWQPLLQPDDNPLSAAIRQCHALANEHAAELMQRGCPFNNLINEMAGIDEGFRSRLQTILDETRSGIAAALRSGQQRRCVRTDIDPADCAAFIISSIEGGFGLAKAQSSPDFLEASLRGLIQYLESLRAPH